MNSQIFNCLKIFFRFSSFFIRPSFLLKKSNFYSKIQRKFYSTNEHDEKEREYLLPPVYQKSEKEFKSELNILLSSLNRHITYRLEYFMFAYTNDKFKTVIYFKGMDKNYRNVDKHDYKLVGHNNSSDSLDSFYKYKGYISLFQDFFENEKHLHLDKYISGVLQRLREKTYFTFQENLKEEYIESRFPTVLKISIAFKNDKRVRYMSDDSITFPKRNQITRQYSSIPSNSFSLNPDTTTQKRTFSWNSITPGNVCFYPSFKDNVSHFWLPPLIKTQQQQDQNDFVKELVAFLKDFFSSNDFNLSYKLEFCLFFHSNDNNLNIMFSLPRDSGLEHIIHNYQGFELYKYLAGFDYLYKFFKYHGFYRFKSDELSTHITKDLNTYANNVYKYLIDLVPGINGNHLEKGFIEFRASTLLKIVLLKSSNDGPVDNFQSESNVDGGSAFVKINKSDGLMWRSDFHSKRFSTLVSTLRDKASISNENIQIDLGICNSNEFKLKIKKLIDMFIKNDNKNKYELMFYSYKTFFDGSKTSLIENYPILITKIDLSTYCFENQKYKYLISHIVDRIFQVEDSFERDFRKKNNIGEYYDEEFICDYQIDDSYESIDDKVFVEIKTKI